MITNPTIERCGLCACRLKDGRCHRYPPTIDHPNRDRSAWPVVEEEAVGCFEFRAKHLLEVPAVKEELRKAAEGAVKSGDLKVAENNGPGRAPAGKRNK
jgi:hypothetical protein